MLQMGYRTDVSGANKSTNGGIAPFWGAANLTEKVSPDTAYRSDSIPLSRDMGSLRLQFPPFTIRDSNVTRLIP